MAFRGNLFLHRQSTGLMEGAKRELWDHWFPGFEEVQDPEDEHKMAIQMNIRKC